MKVACLWFTHSLPSIKKLAENCLRLSPQICFRGEEALFIEYGKCRRLYSEEGFFARLQVILRRLDLHPTIAMGHDIPDSLALAKFQRRTMDELPLLALLDLADPFGKDPVARMSIQKMISSFSDLGIQSIAGFRKIPVSDLVSRFGAIAVLCQQRARGEVSIPWPMWKPEEIISEKSEFPYFEFYGELEPILFELKKQLDQVFQRLWARGLKAQSLQVRIFCEKNSANPEAYRNFDFDFLYPQSTTKGALNVIKERLARDFEKKPIVTPIEGLSTTVTASAPSQVGQKNLFHNREEIAEQLHSLLSQLGETHGRENIFYAQLVEDRRPERSWKRTAQAPAEKSQLPTLSVDLRGKIPLRPTYLLRPEKIEITAGYVHIRRKPFKILKWSDSVERITGGWIEKSHVTNESIENTFDRNYYSIELVTGTTISVFQTPLQHYYLHGYFG